MNPGPWNRKWPGAAGTLRAMIAGGTLEPGAAVIIARLAPELGVSLRTAARALAVLEGEGLIGRRRPGARYAVLARGEPPR